MRRGGTGTGRSPAAKEEGDRSAPETHEGTFTYFAEEEGPNTVIPAYSVVEAGDRSRCRPSGRATGSGFASAVASNEEDQPPGASAGRRNQFVNRPPGSARFWLMLLVPLDSSPPRQGAAGSLSSTNLLRPDRSPPRASTCLTLDQPAHDAARRPSARLSPNTYQRADVHVAPNTRGPPQDRSVHDRPTCTRRPAPR